MVINGCSSCVMEVSSHAIEQGRVESIDFDVAVFTNLTQDHLDFHKSMENYAAAKAKLFLKQPKTAVVNGDSPWTDSILQGYCGKVMKYGIDCEAALRAHEIQLTPHKTIFNLIYAGQTYSVSSALVGRYNVYNTLAAISVALSKGISIEHILTAVKTFKPVGGRLEPVPNQKKLSIFVDYAHTDDALKNVLETLREFKEGRIITVFGCGGNRDQQKRPKMAKVAETHSDVVIVTSDNPRQEDPQEIIRQIFSGFANPGHAIVEPDRREAIHRAVHMAGPNDLILIAGKGHETYQIFSHQTIEFDYRKIAQEAALS